MPEKIFSSTERNIHSLQEMKESLFVLRRSYDAITVIIKRLINSSHSFDQQMLEILQLELQLTNTQIEKLHKLIHHRLSLAEQSS